MKKLFFALIFMLSLTMAQAEEIYLAPVVVSATKYASNSLDIPVSVDVISKEIIEEQTFALTPAQSLARAPGISIANTFDTDIRIQSRGFGSKSPFASRGIKLYKDGIPVSTADGFGATSLIDLNTIGNIEVMKGPFSSMYGTTPGGVVQFFTDIPTEPNKVEGAYLFGSNGTKESNAQYSGTDGSMKYLVSYADFSTDGVRDYSKFDRNNTTGKVWFNPSDYTKVEVGFNNYHQWGQDYGNGNGGITAKQLTIDPHGVDSSVLNIGSWKDVNQTDGSLKIDHFVNDDNMVSLAAYGGIRNQEQLSPSSESEVLANTTTSLLKTDRVFYGSEVRWDHFGNLSGHEYKLSGGLSYAEMNDDVTQAKWMFKGVKFSNAGEVITKNVTQTARSFDRYAQGQIAVTNTVSLHGGIRRSTTDLIFKDNMTDTANGGDNGGNLSYEKTTPAIGIVWQPNKVTDVYASYGKGAELPSFVEAQSKVAVSTTRPNDTLNPSTSDNYEVGVKSFILPDTYVTAAAYLVKTKDEILIASSVPGFKIFSNQGNTTRKGVDLSVDTKLPLGFGFYGMYSYIDAAFDADGNKIPAIPSNNLFAELSWKYAPIGFKVSGEAVHSGKQYAEVDNSVSANGYTVYNLKASLKQNVNHFVFTEFASINNLTDETYVNSVRTAASYGRYYEVAPGKTWMLGLSAGYTF